MLAGAAEEGSVRYTRGKDGKFGFAILKKWPGGKVVLRGIRAVPDSRVTMLGVREPLAWRQDEQGLAIAIPAALQEEKSRPCQHAWVLKVSLK